MKKTKLMPYTLSGIDVSQVPEEIKILPLGHVTSMKGDFEVDDESCQCIIKQFQSRNLDLVIDYEHQTLDNEQAPASGWIKELYQGTDALIAKVDWTPKAREYLANKEYRYLSPVVLARKSDNKAIILHSAALTNTPAINGMFAIVNSDGMVDYTTDENERDGKSLDLEKLIELLGLPETATEEEVSAKLSELIAKNKPTEETKVVANKTVLDLLGLGADAGTEDVTAKIMSFKSGDVQLLQRVKDLETEAKKREANDLVQMALKDGKISADQKGWAVDYAVSSPEGFKLFVEKAPVTVPTYAVAYAKDPAGKDSVDMLICKNQGVSKADYDKYYGGRKDD